MTRRVVSRIAGQAMAWTLMWVSAFACSAVAPPPAQPSAMQQPQGALPADLDMAFRVNLQLLASELGQPLAEQLLVDTLGEGDAPASSLLRQALKHSELMWLGVRAGAALDAAEKVLILRGHFAEVLRRQPAADSVWAASTPALRPRQFSRGAGRLGALVHVYPVGDELLLAASAAQVSAVERWFERGTDNLGLRPPERGAVSAAARPERLRELYLQPYPELAAHFSGTRQLQAYFDVRAESLIFELELSFQSAAQAADASHVFEQLRLQLASHPCAIGGVARAAHVSVFERSLRLLGRLDPARMRGLEACILGGECCA